MVSGHSKSVAPWSSGPRVNMISALRNSFTRKRSTVSRAPLAIVPRHIQGSILPQYLIVGLTSCLNPLVRGWNPPAALMKNLECLLNLFNLAGFNFKLSLSFTRKLLISSFKTFSSSYCFPSGLLGASQPISPSRMGGEFEKRFFGFSLCGPAF